MCHVMGYELHVINESCDRNMLGSSVINVNEFNITLI